MKSDFGFVFNFSLSERKVEQKKQTNLQFDRLCGVVIHSPCFISGYFPPDRHMAGNRSKIVTMRTLFWQRFIFSPFPHSLLRGADLNDETFKICTQIHWSQAGKNKKSLPKRLCVIKIRSNIPQRAESVHEPPERVASKLVCEESSLALPYKSKKSAPSVKRNACVSFGTFLYTRKVQ